MPEGEPIFAMPIVVEEPSAALAPLEAASVSLPAMVEVEESREPSRETAVEAVPAVPVRERSVPLQLGVRQLWPPLEGVPVDEVDESSMKSPSKGSETRCTRTASRLT